MAREGMTQGTQGVDTAGDRRDDVRPLQPHERLNNGDADAIDEVFSAYEPHLRMLIRRQLPRRFRAKFDSGDVIQTVWTSLLEGLRQDHRQFSDESHLRAFLVRLALFRFIDLCRQYRLSLGRERPLAILDVLPAAAGDRPSEILQASQLLDRLMNLCPPSHRELLRLRAIGLPLAEIAARTGYHEGSIRRIFYDLARRLDSRDGRVQESREEDPPSVPEAAIAIHSIVQPHLRDAPP